KALAEHGDKVGAAEKSAIESAVAEMKQAIAGDDIEVIRAKVTALAQASMKLGEVMYKAQSESETPAGGNAGAEAGGKDEDVVDADFEEVRDDENKKSA